MKKKEMYEVPSVQVYELAMENTILDASLAIITISGLEESAIDDITYGGSF